MAQVGWLLCDYGEVLCRAQPAADRAGIEAAAGRAGNAFWSDYWAHRPAYDRGDLTAAAYWALVAGRPLTSGGLARLVGLDVASWLHPEPAALAAAGRAASRGVRLAILSNAPVEVAAAVDGAPWLAAFSPRLFSCRLGAVKPEPEAFERSLAALGAGAGEVVFLDDRPGNVAGARRAGLRAELYRSPEQFDGVSG